MDSKVILDALSGSRGIDQKRIAQVGIDWVETILKKNLAYGSSVWKEPVLAPQLPVRSAILVRMSDKVSRINSLMGGVPDEVGEAIDETIKDLGAYCLLYLAQPAFQHGVKTDFVEEANRILDMVAEEVKIKSMDPYQQYPYVSTDYDKARTAEDT